MAKDKHTGKEGLSPSAKPARRAGASRPGGVWNRGTGKGPSNPIRVRTKRLDEVDGDKIALAYWMLAKQLVVDRSGEPLPGEQSARAAAAQAEGTGAGPETKSKPRAPRGRKPVEGGQ